MSPSRNHLVALLSGLLGAIGVALAAVASHAMPDPALAMAAQMLVLHATAGLAVTALASQASRPHAWIGAAILLLAGAALFTADISFRAFLGGHLFPMAAPIGGTAMILGWLAAAVAAALECRRKGSNDR